MKAVTPCNIAAIKPLPHTIFGELDIGCITVSIIDHNIANIVQYRSPYRILRII